MKKLKNFCQKFSENKFPLYHTLKKYNPPEKSSCSMYCFLHVDDTCTF